MADEPIDIKTLETILEEFKGKKGPIIPILQRT